MKLKDIFKKVAVVKLVIATALLGAYGGQGHKEYRRIYIPLIIMILALLRLRNLLTLTIMSMAGFLSMGYGIPDPPDEGSSLGKFWLKIFKGNEYWANVFTRGTIGLLVSLSLISIPISKGNWIMYLIGCGLIKLTYAFMSWRDLGVINIEDKHLLKSDLLTYGIVGLAGGLLIYV
ncbi:MAG: hypothetical protein ACFFAU_01495 [Candidatus Hodarchaeota archaeon]